MKVLSFSLFQPQWLQKEDHTNLQIKGIEYLFFISHNNYTHYINAIYDKYPLTNELLRKDHILINKNWN